MISLNTEALIPPKDANPALATLHEITAPADINWWPQTLGWQILVFLMFCYVLYRVYLMVNRYISNAYRRAALVEIINLNEAEQVIDYAKVSQILRRTALYAFNRKDVAPLIGHHWECWLDQQCKGCDFSGEFKGLISQLAYAPPASIPEATLAAFKSQVVLWIKHHRGQHG